MANGRSTHQPAKQAGRLVALRPDAQIYSLPLLPYERQLIEALGCTETEYRRYRQQLVNAGLRRPAAYDQIPEVVAGPVTPILINLAIGAALTAVSALLQPKPKQQQKIKQGGQVKLDDQQGRSRFNQTQGFGGVQDVAALGSPIPILFGRYEQHDRSTGPYFTGGISAAPQLIWSRMFSYGSHQGFKGLYSVGECLGDRSVDVIGAQDPTRPDAESVQLGTLPLNSVPPEQQALYWNTNFNQGRIKAADLFYGTRAEQWSGDPETYDDVFMCPVNGAVNEEGFSMALTPSGNTTFGVYQPVPNGTAFRVNWKIVPIPRLIGQKDDPDGRLKAERTKIAGTEAHDDDKGMPGKGRSYCPLMGVVSHNGQRKTSRVDNQQVRVGDVIEYVILGRQLKASECDIDEDKTGLDVTDINNALNSRRANADDQLQVGELFMIGRTVWQVTSRSGGEDGVWLPDGPDVVVTLKMIETTIHDEASIIGIAGEQAVGYGDPVQSEGLTFPEEKYCGISFWPLAKVALGTVRNVRPANTTELGIRSQVWNQANGLCNFNSIPTPNKLIKYERPNSDKENGAQIQSGTMSTYFARTSLFTIYLRPVGLDVNGRAYDWLPLGEQFAVTGSQPVDQFNFIRISSNEGPKQMEFRFIPKTNAQTRYLTNPDAQFWRLNAKAGQRLAADYQTGYGTFNVSCVGDIVTAGDLDPKRTIVNSQQMKTQGRPPNSTIQNRPTDVIELYRLPDVEGGGTQGAYFYELFGDPDSNANRERTAVITAYDGTTKRMDIEITVRSEYWGRDSAYFQKFNREYKWIYKSMTIKSYVMSWGVGDVGDHRVNLDPSSNPFAQVAGIDYAVVGYQVTNVVTEVISVPGEEERWFEQRTQLAEVSHYDELNKSCDSNPEHELVYVNECVENKIIPQYPLTTFGLAVRSGNAIQGIEQLRIWLPDGVRVKRWIDGTYGPSNLFSDLAYYLLTDDVAGIGNAGTDDLQWIDQDSFEVAAKYLKANNIYFDGVLDESVNLRSYLAEIAPLNLCNFVVANGRFAVTPALPYDPTTYAIAPKSVPIAAIFSEGNIVEGSYSVDYLEAAERESFEAVVQYRECEKDKLPENRTVMVRWAEYANRSLPQEVFDLSGFCTDAEQAKMIGRYMLSIRRRVDHAISFETLPLGLKLSPGSYIKVVTSSAPESTAAVGVLAADDGRVLTTEPLADGVHEVTGYKPGEDDAKVISLTIKDGHVTDPALFGTVFSSLVPRPMQNVYLVEQLELTDDGKVQVTASHYPIGATHGNSMIAMDVIDEPMPDGSSRFLYVK